MEGWPHYCEGLMAREGFPGTSERGSGSWDIEDAELWRVIRGQADLGLLTGSLSLEEALRSFQSLGMDAVEARGEVAALIANPTYGLSYAVGRLMLEELPSIPRAEQRTRFERILSAGLVPLAVVIRQL